MRTALIAIILIAAALIALGYIGGTYEGAQPATVTSAQSAPTWKSNSPETRIHATLSDGTEIYTTSPHAPAPEAGQRIVLDVRRNLLGWRSYTWQPGKTAAP